MNIAQLVTWVDDDVPVEIQCTSAQPEGAGDATFVGCVLQASSMVVLSAVYCAAFLRNIRQHIHVCFNAVTCAEMCPCESPVPKNPDSVVSV